MADAMTTSAHKERTLLAVMAGRSSAQDAASVRVGAEIENAALWARIELLEARVVALEELAGAPTPKRKKG